MDSDSKRLIRRISIPLFWIAEVYLLVVLVVGVYVKYYEEELPEAMIGLQAIEEVVMADEVLMHAMTRTSLSKESALVSFLPPANADSHSIWAAQVKEHLDVECAVFFFDGKETHWPLLPQAFEYKVPFVDSLVRTPFKTDSTMRIKKFGTFEQLTVWSLNDGPRIEIMDIPDSDTRWGVLFEFSDLYYYSFARLLNKSRSYSTKMELGEFSSMFDMKKSAVVADSIANWSKFGLQIFTQSDSLLFETPGIDTSFHKIEQRHETMPTYSIVYNTGRNERFLAMVKERFKEDFSVPWVKLLFVIFEMIVLALFYFWIGRLTKIT